MRSAISFSNFADVIVKGSLIYVIVKLMVITKPSFRKTCCKQLIRKRQTVPIYFLDCFLIGIDLLIGIFVKPAVKVYVRVESKYSAYFEKYYHAKVYAGATFLRQKDLYTLSSHFGR